MSSILKMHNTTEASNLRFEASVVLCIYKIKPD